jgi:hypothetical protein
MTDLSFIFVADGPRFEDPAILLAGSMRVHHGDAVAIYAYCPEEKLDTLSPEFRSAMDLLDVQVTPIPTGPTPFETPYPHGNKILAAMQPRTGKYAVFFDTDMILRAPVAPEISHGLVGAVPEGVPTWGREVEDWAPVYAHFGLPLPTERVRMCRGRRRETLPYFNAGLVSFPELASDGRRFGEIWLDTAVGIDHCDAFENKRPWLDQIALPVAIARSGLDWEVLPEKLNYSLFRRKMPLAHETTVVHYHLPGLFRTEIGCMTSFRDVLHMLPDEMAQAFRARALAFEMPARKKKRAGFVPILDLDATD